MAHFCQSITKLQIPLRSVAASRSFFLTDDIVTWHPLTLPWGDRAITSQLRLANPPPPKKYQVQPPRALGRAGDIFRLQDLKLVPNLPHAPASTARATPRTLHQKLPGVSCNCLITVFQILWSAQKAWFKRYGLWIRQIWLWYLQSHVTLDKVYKVGV